MKMRLVFVTLFFTFCLFGCGTTPRQGSLYSWGSYEAGVFAHINRESDPHTQIGIMERELQEILASGKNIPPGFNAHIGILYSETGNHAGASAYFRMEKTLFPESAVFMDFLLARLVLEENLELPEFLVLKENVGE
jgi:hypothetical protein